MSDSASRVPTLLSAGSSPDTAKGIGDKPQGTPAPTELTVGEAIRISFAPWNDDTTPDNFEAPMYSAVIRKVLDDMLVLQAWLSDGNAASLSPGAPATLLRTNGGRALIYPSRVTSIMRNNPVVLAITTPKRYIELERRAFFRLGMEAEIRYVSIPESSGWRTGTLRDISEGGICLFDSQPRMVGEQLLVELPVDGAPLRVKGVVRRCDAARPNYAVAIQFTELDRPDQHRLRKFVFSQQIKRAK